MVYNLFCFNIEQTLVNCVTEPLMCVSCGDGARYSECLMLFNLSCFNIGPTTLSLMFYYIFINDVSDSDGDDGNTNYNLIEGRNGNIFSKAIAEHA